jgi:hypothetical protein
VGELGVVVEIAAVAEIATVVVAVGVGVVGNEEVAVVSAEAAAVDVAAAVGLWVAAEKRTQWPKTPQFWRSCVSPRCPTTRW